jgi:hypothetical protein
MYHNSHVSYLFSSEKRHQLLPQMTNVCRKDMSHMYGREVRGIKVLVGRPQGERLLGRIRSRW